MGIFDKILDGLGSSRDHANSQRVRNPWGGYGSRRLSPDFINMVVAYDRGEEWAQQAVMELRDPISSEDASLARLEGYYESALNGDEDALRYIGASLAAFNPPESIQILTDLANKGDAKSMRALAMNYGTYGYYGHNEEREFHWLLKAAEAGSGAAQAQVGLKYVVDGNQKEAERWYKKSADNGDLDGMVGLADCYGYDRVMTQDKAKSEEYENMEEQLLLEVWDEYYYQRDDRIEEVSMKLGSFYRYTKKDFGEALKFYYFATKFSQSGKEHGERMIKEIEDENGVRINAAYKNDVDNMF